MAIDLVGESPIGFVILDRAMGLWRVSKMGGSSSLRDFCAARPQRRARRARWRPACWRWLPARICVRTSAIRGARRLVVIDPQVAATDERRRKGGIRDTRR